MSLHRFYRGRVLDRELRALYEERGKLPDMTRLEHAYHRRTTRILGWLTAFLLILVGASWAGFFLFGPKGGADTEIELRLDGPSAVISGVPQTLTLHYKNQDRAPVGLVRLTLRVPEGLLIKEVSPASDEEGRLAWNIGTLPSKEGGTLEMRVVPYGVAGTTLSIQALASYKPANFNAEFQSTANYDLAIREAGIEAVLEAPTAISVGQEIAATVRYVNRTDETFEGVRAVLDHTSPFALTSSQPKDDKGVWTLGTLEAGKEGALELKGVFLSAAQGQTPMTVRFEKAEGSKTYALGEASSTIDVAPTPLAVELLLNNTTDVRWVRLGDELGFRVKLTNNGTDTIPDARAQVTLTSPLLDLSSIKAEDGKVEGNVVRFPNDGALAIEAGKLRELTFSVRVMPTASPTVSPTVDAQAEVAIGEARIKSNPIQVFVVSNLAVASEARYFAATGQPIGGGPLPPKVGEATTYELRWRVRNTFHDLANVVVTATLPEGVSWLNRTRADTGLGTISFNAATREVRWAIPRLPITTSEASVTFEVSATPKENQRGQLMLLLGVTRAEAQDVITGVTFSSDAPSLSSALDADPQGRGKGVVQ